MKTITQKAYTIEELEKLDYRAYESAYDNWGKGQNNLDLCGEEIYGSVFAFLKHCGLKPEGNREYDKVSGLGKKTGALNGKRAIAWFENNILSGLRIKNTIENRKNAIKYGKVYSIGRIKPCPFTGYCFDDEIISFIKDELKKGETLQEAFDGVFWLANKRQDKENEYFTSEEYFKQECSDFDRYFDETGREV